MNHLSLSDIKDLVVTVIGAVAAAYVAIAVQLKKMHATSRDTNSKVNGNIDSLVKRIEELSRAISFDQTRKVGSHSKRSGEVGEGEGSRVRPSVKRSRPSKKSEEA